MSTFTTSPNMGLTIPTVGQEPGPQWASDLNASLTLIDTHTHAPGEGVPITPAGMSITSDLTFINNNATNLKSVRFYVQPSLLSGVADVGCIYSSGVDLYYNDGNSNQIRMTQSGGVAGTPGSITGLVSPATATYVPASQTFVWQSAVNTAANLDAGSVIIREVAASANGITLSSPTSLVANFVITLPPKLPSATAVYQTTSAGVSSFVGGWVPLYDAVVGSAAQVTGGIATHSTLSSAITAVSSNGSIKLLQGAWTENITLAKTLNIVGSGYNTVITGNLTISSANYCEMRDLQFTGNVSVTGTSTGNFVSDVYIGSSSTFSDTNTVSDNGNFYHFIKG